MAGKRFAISKRRTLLITLGLVLSLSWYLSGTKEERLIILPCITLLNVSVYFWCSLWQRGGSLPILNSGSMFVAACMLYIEIPAVGFLATNMKYNVLSTPELYNLSPDAMQLHPLVWRYVLYAIAFMAVYLWFSPRGREKCIVDKLPPKNVIVVLGVLIVIAEGGFAMLGFYYGLDFGATYDRIDEVFETFSGLPLLVQQALGNIIVITVVLKMYFIVLVIARWRRELGGTAVIGFCLALVTLYATRQGSRTGTLVLLLTCGLAYHRFVKPIGISTAVISCIVLVGGFMLIGLMRGGGDLSASIEQLRYLGSFEVPILSIANEFQVLFGCTYDWLNLKISGVWRDIPLQLYFYDILVLIPRQVLPFEKINPTLWYWEFTSTRGFFSFNPIAQSIIGLDWIELILRGSVLGYIFAKAHEWYLRRCESFCVSFLYIFLVAWSYYSIKGSTFVWMYFVIYRLVPAMMLIYVVNGLMPRKSAWARKQFARVAVGKNLGRTEKSGFRN